jgi:hypothetical protein
MKIGIRIKITAELVTSQIKPLCDVNRSIFNKLPLLIWRCKVMRYKWKLKIYVEITSTQTDPPECELGTVTRNQPTLSP